MPSPAGPFDAISGDYKHVCGIYSADKTIVCWGVCPSKRYPATNHCEPDEPASTRYVAVSVGRWHACAIKEQDSQITCWGTESFSGGTDKLTGDSSYHMLVVPSPEPSGGYSALSVHDGVACAIETVSKTVKCWGNDAQGKASPEPTKQFSSVTMGIQYGCGIEVGTNLAICWGTSSYLPLPASMTSAPVTQIATWWMGRACVILQEDSTIVCSSSDWYAPPTGTTATSISNGWAGSCWIGTDGMPACNPCHQTQAAMCGAANIPAALQP